MTIISTTLGKNPLEKNEVAIIVNKRVKNAVLGCNLMISVHFQGKPFNAMVIWVYAPTSNAKEAEGEWFYEDLQRPSRINTQKRCPFHYRRLEWKSRKSRNTWGNRQIWPWSTEWSRAKVNRVRKENALVIANSLFKQHKRRFYTWTSPDSQQQNQTDYILWSQQWRSSI